MNVVRLAALVLVFVLAACAPGSSFNYSGQWTGTIQDSLGGPGTISASIAQSGRNLTGTWSATFNSGNSGGSLTGVVTGNSVVVELEPSNRENCPFRLVANRSGNTMSGDYSAFDCTRTVTGTISLTK